MKHICIYEYPDDEVDHRLALQGKDWALVVWEIDEWLRGQIKYKSHDTSQFQEARDKLHDWMDHHGVTLDDIP